MNGLSVDIQFQSGALQLNVQLQNITENLAIIGSNGVGKTSLLRLLAGGLSPQRGFIQLHQQYLYQHKSSTCLPPEERSVGYVPQGYGLFPHLDVLDNVAFGLLAQSPRLPRKQRQQKAFEWLQHWGCEHLAHRLPTHLSGGEKQRVALARSLLTSPSLLLLDEPLSALDQQARQKMRSLMTQHIAKQGCLTVLVTHELDDVRALCTQVAVLDKGRVVQVGTLEDLKANPATEFVKEFVREL